MSRRRFLRHSLFASAGAALSGCMGYKRKSSMPQHIGIQLYSVRDDIVKDPAAVLEALARMGYREVEAYGFEQDKLFGLSYAEFGNVLAANGLSMPSVHNGISLDDYDPQTRQVSDAVKKRVDAAAAMGLRYVVCPWMREADRERIAQTVELYQAMAACCQRAGVRFAYHNHNFEFESHGPDNRPLMEWIIRESDPAQMALEMDIYWVSFAGQNPLDWIRQYPGRWELCHAKDMAAGGEHPTVEVGDGVIDFKSIFQQSASAGFQYYFVELEHYQTTPLQGAERARLGLLKQF